jgi:uncharacterized protein YraI
MTTIRRAVAVALAAAIAFSGCGDDDDVSSDTTAPTSETTTSSATTATTATTTTAAPGDLPGERVDIFPYAGAALSVVGVAHDDTLNVRAGPGTGYDVVGELEPTAGGLVATGHVRDLGDSFWTEVEVDDRTGWVNVRHVTQFGATDDVTAQIASSGGLPTAGSVLDLGLAVAERRASEEPPSDVVVVVAPTEGDLGEVTLDVIGFGDDAVGGERLHVFAATEDGGATYYVKSVERTVMCTRGVEGGVCL